jgi:predicted polyphosphate/ATP-dependent NAD kinase
MQVQDGPTDTVGAVERMAAARVSAIVVLGGDGTHRLVAATCGQIPLMALSTGTNNVFPEMREAP